MYKINIIITVVISLFLFTLGIAATGDEQIFGCGGFLRSNYEIDFSKVDIKLYTKHGSLKLQTECAPTTGYYFMPLEIGEYVLKVSPPPGWTFHPSEFHINFDGTSDQCSKGVDMNFDFKGFSVTGKITTKGYEEGPSDVLLTLGGKDDFFLKTKSKSGGLFVFDSIPPGKYTLRSSHTGVTFERDLYNFDVTGNVNIEKQIIVSGYEISGKVTSEKHGVEGVTLVLIGESAVTNIQGCTPGKPKDDFKVPANGPKHIICHKTSDSTGTFRFKNVTPGKYTVIPVYKGQNIVYNVSPDLLNVDLHHKSVELSGFEVDGFTVLGKVKGIPNAKILINGEVRATSAKDGSFSISKMKQGTYEFEIQAENYQFEKLKIKVLASNPVLPDFEPSKFLICGTVKSKARESTTVKLWMNFERTSHKNEIQREKVTTSSNNCYFLSKGKYIAKVESQPEKFFIPDTQVLEVPGGTFAFTEFNGFISGKVKCPLADGKCEAKIQLLQKDSILAEDEVKGGVFKFSELESGEDYELRIVGPRFCWKEEKLIVKLKNTNVENLEFLQTGFSLTVTSSHSSKISIISKKKKNILEEAELAKSGTKNFCLTEYSIDGYEIRTESCHIFKDSPINFKLEKSGQTKVNIVAEKHEFIGMIQTNSPLTGLQVKRNGEILEEATKLNLKEHKNGKYDYVFKTMEKAGESITLDFFSYDFIFEPKTVNFVAGDDCKNGIFQVTGHKSEVIKGKLVPPLEGVEIRIDLLGDADSTSFVHTNDKGEYIAGPFIHSNGFKVTPKMSGYTFKPFGDGYSFNVLQWAKIQVNIVDVNNQNPVPSALLSLSGPNSYRQNKITDANGEMIFSDLQPGTYFLKALLKEFSFEPSAIHIELQEQESKQVKLNARRESFSLFGDLSSFSGDVMPNLMVSAKGQGNCSEYGEEGVSDDNGNFRIWSLRSYCTYKVSVVKKDDFASRVERTIPNNVDVKIGTEDVQNITFVIIQPVMRMDISLRCRTKNVRSLESLRALVYSPKSPDTPIHSIPFNGVSYIILPPIPKDSLDYFIVFESSLSRSTFEYTLPSQINFTAKEAYAHFAFDFNVFPIHHDQDIGKSSYLAFCFIIFVFLVLINFERLSKYAREGIDKYLQSTSAAAAASKRKLKAK